MKFDIVALLRDVLSNAGMLDFMDDDISNHSTITLSMKDDIPSIHIKNDDDENIVWVWAKILDEEPQSYHYCSDNLLLLMLEHNEEFFVTGQPCLYPIDGGIELRAQVKEKYLNSADEFLLFMDEYLTMIEKYRNILI